MKISEDPNINEAFIKIKNNLLDREHCKKYRKLSFDELYEELKDVKGIKFTDVTKEEATAILTDLNYYYKLTVYKRSFKRDKETGKFIDLEFKTLCSIASVDMQLRYLFAEACMDIEHALKTYIISHITNNDEIDGFEIVNRFIHSTTEKTNPLTLDGIMSKANYPTHYQYNMYQVHKETPPIWVVMEMMSFGDLVRFFAFYFKLYPSTDFDLFSMKSVLMGVKNIRNMSVHNNPFLFDLGIGEIDRPNKYIKLYGKEVGVGEWFYKSLKVNDTLSVFYAHRFFVKGEGSRKYRIDDFKKLIDRTIDRFKYIGSTNDIMYYFNILSKVVDNQQSS
ncbi:Abi family protein [Vagococcus vulneris]|nr:Abi family protein [Vagococcus vulneris]